MSVNKLPDLLVDGFVDASVTTEETTVVSGWDWYEPFCTFVHSVNAICDLSSWYLLINSFGVNFLSFIISKIENFVLDQMKISFYFVYCRPYLKNVSMVAHDSAGPTWI
jgi:hypothetical protein